MFRVAPSFELKALEEIFRHKVFKMLLAKEKITEDLVDMLMKWRHSGFNVPQSTFLDKETGEVVWIFEDDEDAEMSAGIKPEENNAV